MSRKKKVQVGDLVRVTFHDHAENSKDALEFEVFGRVFDETRLAYKIRCWGYVHDTDRAADSSTHNEHYYTIVKRAITGIKVLK